MSNLRIEVPSVGESVKEGVLVSWLVRDGEKVYEGTELFELETDKATMAVPSPGTGILRIGVPEGSDVKIGQVVGELEPSAEPLAKPSAPPVPAEAAGGKGAAGEATSEPRAAQKTAAAERASTTAPSPGGKTPLSPAVRRIVEETGLDTGAISGTGKGGRITKGDVLQALKSTETPAASAADGATRALSGSQPERGPRPAARREKMSVLRRAIGRRLVEAKTQTAHLTTFNEVSMERIMALRASWQETFEKRHGVRLGFMSFFIKASCQALAELPVVNAMIDGEEIVYHDVHDIGVAVTTDRGLVVPVIRDADRLSLAELERTLGDLAERARAKKILPDELAGGTFTITNGGVFGSLLSTPIINYPQSAILGMHAIQKRPVVVDDQIVIRPMMYVALSYDHRLIDGREAVTFLTRVKALCENPERLLLEV